MDKLDDPSFLSRWSRRKQGEEREQSAEPAVAGAAPLPEILVDGPAPAVPDAAVPAESGDAPALALSDTDLPDPDSLNVHSDFSGFLGEGISEALRRKALKKLFHLPEFNLRDGLNEYDDDFSRYEPLGDTVTYQMKQWLERQKNDFQQALDGEEAAGESVSEPATPLEAQGESAPVDADEAPSKKVDDSF